MSDKYQPIYCVLHERPTIYLYGSGSFAWWCKDGEWVPAPWAEAACNAWVIDKTDFETRFGKLPPFPKAMLDQVDWQVGFEVEKENSKSASFREGL